MNPATSKLELFMIIANGFQQGYKVLSNGCFRYNSENYYYEYPCARSVIKPLEDLQKTAGFQKYYS